MSVGFSSTATDLVDGDIATTCAPAAGSVFPIAATVVACQATDAHGNTGQASFTVTVEEQSSGNTAPLITSIASSHATLATPAVPGIPVTVSGTLVDADVADSHRATIDWGDGTAPQTFDAVENGSQGSDWFFSNRVADDGGVLDLVADRASKEAWDDIDSH